MTPDTIAYDRLVYAVYETGISARADLLGCAFDERIEGCRFVEEDVSDIMLLRNVADGDKVAMHIMFARYRAEVFRFIQRTINSPVIVRELVGQVFLDAWRSSNGTERDVRVSEWLLMIASFRKASEQDRILRYLDKNDLLRVVGLQDRLGEASDGGDMVESWRGSLDKLSRAHAEIIQLFYCREKSIGEVSEILGEARATVKSRLFYARKQLASILVGAGSASGWPRQTERVRAARPFRAASDLRGPISADHNLHHSMD